MRPRLEGKRVFVAGHRGMVGSALVRRLKNEPCDVVTVDRGRLDLRRQSETEDWLAETRPDFIFVAAAKVGGILDNSRHSAEFLYDNLMIEANVVEAARRIGVEKLVLLGSSCIYPKFAPQPIPEAALLTGPLEPTNEPYAIAKIAGIKLVDAYRTQYGCDFVSAQPSNLYGPNDNFDLETSHVLAALIRKIHEAKALGHEEVVVWGSGTPLREFLHVDDLADALVFLATGVDGVGFVNVGSGEEVSINQLATMIAAIVGFEGRFIHDETKPDGTPRKIVDSTLMHSLGWRHAIPLNDGLRRTCSWYQANIAARESPPQLLARM